MICSLYVLFRGPSQRLRYFVYVYMIGDFVYTVVVCCCCSSKRSSGHPYNPTKQPTTSTNWSREKEYSVVLILCICTKQHLSRVGTRHPACVAENHNGEAPREENSLSLSNRSTERGIIIDGGGMMWVPCIYEVDDSIVYYYYIIQRQWCQFVTCPLRSAIDHRDTTAVIY